jgi:hypothetical protein
MRRLIAAAAGAIGLLTAAGVALGALGTAAAEPPGSVSRPIGDIPASLLSVYQAAAETCPGLPWTVLGAIGKVESNHGRSTASGVHSGENSAGAGGPMQFLATTWAAYGVDAHHDGQADRYDITDAIFGAARYLCANDAGKPARLRSAIYAYNHATWYVDAVLRQAHEYAAESTTAPVVHRERRIVAFAYAHLGDPYVWGATGPHAYDCSGLTQAAYAAAGITIPRTAEQQWLGLPHIPFSALRPGDLVFFNPGEFAPGLPGHVGIYIGTGKMIDAPHTGSTVRIDIVGGYGLLVGAARTGG